MAHAVVGGALVRDGRVLLGHRRADRRWFPDCWDVLGGHVEPDETPIDALVRELREEAGVQAQVTGLPALHLEDRAEARDGLVMDVWAVTSWIGEPVNAAVDEHDALQWFATEDLLRLRLAHSSYPRFLRRLLSEP